MQSTDISRSMIDGTLSESDYNKILAEIDKPHEKGASHRQISEPTQDEA